MTHPPHGPDDRAAAPDEGRDEGREEGRAYGPPPGAPYGRPPENGTPPGYGTPVQPGTPPPYGPPPYGSPPRYAPPQYGPPAVFGPPSHQPNAYGQSGQQPPTGAYGPPQAPPGYGQRPTYGPGQYGQPPQYGQPQYGQYGQQPAPWGPPVQPSRRSRRPRLLVGLGALAVLVVGLVVVPVLLGRTALDPDAVQRDVAGQFEEQIGTEVNLSCPERMLVDPGRTYRCAGTLPGGAPVSITIRITDEDANYTWSTS